MSTSDLRAVQDLGTSSDGLAVHYETGTEFFRLWLDDELVYSCGLWRDGATNLIESQQAKIDWFATRLGIQPGSHHLDVGCGWAGVLRRLVGTHGATGVGVTMSPAHLTYADEHAMPGLQVHLTNWADFEPTQRFDSISCLDAMEHFASDSISVPEKIWVYTTFFEQCREWLRPEGRLGVQVLCFGSVSAQRAMDGDGPVARLMRDEVFPEAMPPHLSELVLAWERSFEVELLECDAEAYVKTFRAWLAGLRRHEAEARALVGDEVYARYWRYLAALVALYRLREWTLYRIILQPRRRQKG